ncbi:hypothetical protein [uncultured Sphingomonas sp.]|uniref:hypothetical protein n=1 Tax=uncultured Sphingomonas sp. TaxID=158754 RepID=UPI0025D4BAA5|nr:hypothetical protein [uncultured Sphingomonas sp.]
MVASLHTSLDAPVGQAASIAAAQVLTGEALRAIVAERMKQVDQHGRDVIRDQQTNEAPDLPLAAASYLNAVINQMTGITEAARDVTRPDPMTWPWDDQFWKPEDPRANLVKAAALIWAAIDWLDHAPATTEADRG